MIEGVEIKGGADEVAAAAIAAVIDRIARDEEAARQKRGAKKPGLPAWVRALSQEQPGKPRDQTWPE